MKEKKFRIDDAVASTRAALDEGIVPGGGTMLFEAAKELSPTALKLAEFGDEAKGVEIIRTILQRPLRAIAENSGKDSNEVVGKVLEGQSGHGFNASTGEYVDMMKDGIIDPVKVVKAALINAASVGSTILTTEAVVTDIPEPKEDSSGGGGMPGGMPPMGGMGGMDF